MRLAITNAIVGLVVIATGAFAQPETMKREDLSAWIVRASLHASGGARRVTQPVADAMADAAIENPIIRESHSIYAIAAIEVALAWFETGGQLVNDPTGSNDHGASACWAQIYLPHGARTVEGWTAGDLRADPKKCATAAVRLIKASLASSPSCNACGLTVYARGRDTEEGRRLSRSRLALAEKLLREVSR